MKKLLPITLMCLLLAGCYPTSTGMMQSGVVTKVKDNAYQNQVDNSVPANKKGRACTENILGVYAFGDSSLDTAKKNGHMTKVSFYEREYFNVLGVYSKGCTVAVGN